MADNSKLSEEAFLQMATHLGLESNDRAHMSELYVHVQRIKDTIDDLRKIDLGDKEPSNIFTPVSE